MHKVLTPALTQALFRVKESAHTYHEKRIAALKGNSRVVLTSVRRQIREIKWSELNLMRSYIAIEFLDTFFHYCGKGPLPIFFFNTPFMDSHKESVNYFFLNLSKLKIKGLLDLQNSSSVFFMDTFTTAKGFRFEEKVRDANNLSRCYRIDSRSHDLRQLTDLLLGITVFRQLKKKTRSKAKLRVLKKFDVLYRKKTLGKSVCFVD